MMTLVHIVFLLCMHLMVLNCTSGGINCSKPHSFFAHLNNVIDDRLALGFGLNI